MLGSSAAQLAWWRSSLEGRINPMAFAEREGETETEREKQRKRERESKCVYVLIYLEYI